MLAFVTSSEKLSNIVYNFFSVDGPLQVCYVGMAPPNSKFCPEDLALEWFTKPMLQVGIAPSWFLVLPSGGPQRVCSNCPIGILPALAYKGVLQVGIVPHSFSFSPSFLPSFRPSVRPSVLPSFLPSFLDYPPLPKKRSLKIILNHITVTNHPGPLVPRPAAAMPAFTPMTVAAGS